MPCGAAALRCSLGRCGRRWHDRRCGLCTRFATPDCSARKRAKGLAELRHICLESGLSETVRWGHPTYACGGRNVAFIGAFRDDFRLTFFNAALMKDPGRVLEKPGPNSLHPAMIRFAHDARIAEMEPLVRSYLAEARACAEAGTRARHERVELEIPDLVEALDSILELADAFQRLTPGRKRSYLINLSAAKTYATRISRNARFRDGILAEKARRSAEPRRPAVRRGRGWALGKTLAMSERCVVSGLF